MIPVSLAILPKTDTQGTSSQVGLGMTSNGLIRIKDSYIQKLGGCTLLTHTLYGATANILLPWSTHTGVFLIAIGSFSHLEVNTGAPPSQDITPAGYAGHGAWTLDNWGDWLLAAYQGGGIYYWVPSLPLSGSGLALPIAGLAGTTIAATGNSYVSGSGATSLTTVSQTGILVGQTFTLASLTGTGGFASLNGSWVATAGTGGFTLNFTGTSGLGATTITGGNVLGIGVPNAVNGIFVAAPQQQAFAWGIYSATLGAQDPMLIGWCDIANLGEWSASASNQAGSFRPSRGSLIVGAGWVGQIGLFWTDLDLWATQYISFPLVYGFNEVGRNCGLIGRQAWAVLGSRVVWAGQNDFFEYEGGAVRVIPCPVRDFIFNNIVRNGGTNLLIHADANSYFNEVTWRFSQVGSLGYNAYVKWSPNENNAWDVWADPVGGPENPMWINSWVDQSFVHPPLGIDFFGDILQFERVGNAPIIDYDTLALDSFFVTGWFYIAEGRESVTVERINPDFVWVTRPGTAPDPGSTLQLTVYFADELAPIDTAYPVRTYGPFTITPATPYVIIDGSGRLMRLRIDCTTPGTFYRVGKMMAMISPDGSA